MSSHQVLGAAVALAVTTWACGSSGPEDPFTSGPARATVTGIVTAGGSPVPRSTVRIACLGGGEPVVAPTDSTGRYAINLSTGEHPFDGSSGSLLCRFTEPAVGSPRARIDTSLGFARGPVLVALQFVDLREP